MTKGTALVLGLVLATAFSQYAMAHCEVPCGIYGDQRRFEQMLEDQETIAKAVTSLSELMANMGHDPVSINQASRWIATKESHATNIQHTISQYFMSQRIKADSDGYVEKLTAAHAVMVAAMKCKQTADSATPAALKTAIEQFYAVYEGKTATTH